MYKCGDQPDELQLKATLWRLSPQDSQFKTNWLLSLRICVHLVAHTRKTSCALRCQRFLAERWLALQPPKPDNPIVPAQEIRNSADEYLPPPQQAKNRVPDGTGREGHPQL